MKNSHKQTFFISAALIILIVLTIFVAQPPIWVKRMTGLVTQNIGVNISISNTAPTVTQIFNNTLTSVSITENSFTTIVVNFTASDADGAANLNDSTSRVNITRTGEGLRQNSSCTRITTAGNLANYTCNVQVWYFDSSGLWNISAAINDTSNAIGTNISNTTFTLSQTTAFTTFPGNITFASISPGATNTSSDNDPLILNNTGNKEINSTGLEINATNLVGETTSTQALYAANFSISNNTGSSIECNGTELQRAAFVIINNSASPVNANLSRGNHSLNNGVTAYENLYLCLNLAGSELSQQAYSTLSQGPWTIKATYIIPLFPLIKRKLKRKTKT
ncbi:MAG: hypothetical protein AABY22_04205 [Nanoarchaeota archaeon]